MFMENSAAILKMRETIKPSFCILASKDGVKDVAKVSSTDAFMGRNKYVKTKKRRSIDKTNGSSFTFADNYLLS